MCSTRNSLPLAAALALASAAGCQHAGPPPTMRIDNQPLVIDEAMQRRDWDQSTAYYANGVTVAGPTGVYFEPHDRVPPGLPRGAVEAPLFVGHVVLLPFDMLWDPYWEDVAYPRAQSPASYTQAPRSDTDY